MSNTNLPSPCELSQIAATLCADTAIFDPAQAVRNALFLWLAANEEVRHAESRITALELESRKTEQPSKKFSDREILIKAKDGSSPALDWLKNHAKHRRDVFTTPRGFFDAWSKFEPADAFRLQGHMIGELSAPEEKLQRFLNFRSERRRTNDAERKRKSRNQASPKKSQSNK